MTKHYPLCAAALALLTAMACVQGKEVKEAFDNGKAKVVYQTDAAGKKSGPYEEYYDNGKLKCRGNYRQDLKTGPWTECDDAGKPRREENYVAGKLNGLQTFYSPKHILRARVNYVAGAQTGGVALYDDAGHPRLALDYPHTLAMVERAWSELYPYDPLPIAFDIQPVIKAPFTPGVLKKENLDQALNFVKLYRFLAGVNTNITTDPDLSIRGAADAILNLSVDHINSKPAKPAGMSETIYQMALEGFHGSSAISYSRGGHNLVDMIRNFMDSSERERDSVGNRQWLMNPSMDKVGFGFAGDGPSYAVMYNVPKSKTRMTARFTAFPAQGFYPAQLVEPNNLWSVHLNRAIFSIPKTGDVQVRMEHLDDAWEKLDDVAVKVVSVSTERGLPTPVIVFKPDLAAIAPGRYLVQIAGLKASSGDPMVSYVVEFISMADVKQKSPTTGHPAKTPGA